jgi:hypothetical protein
MRFLASSRDLQDLDEFLRTVTQERSVPYGNIAIVFLGDFNQLQPIGGELIYTQPNLPAWEGALNCFIELKGTHRFSQDPVWGELLMKIRECGLTLREHDIINTCVIQL